VSPQRNPKGWPESSRWSESAETTGKVIPSGVRRKKAFPNARLWFYVSTSVRTASGSDRIKTQLSQNNERFKCIA